MSDKILFVSRRGSKPQGPFTIEELAKYATAGKLLKTDMVTSSGADKWFPAGEVPGIFWQPDLNLPAIPKPNPVLQYRGLQRKLLFSAFATMMLCAFTIPVEKGTPVLGAMLCMMTLILLFSSGVLWAFGNRQAEESAID